MIFSILQAAADTTALMQTAPAQQEMKLSLIDLATKGGWLMIVLLILSVMAIYIFGNKWWLIRKAGQIDRNFSILVASGYAGEFGEIRRRSGSA